MAASPLVAPPSNPLSVSLKPVPSPLRKPAAASAVPSSANGTPQPSRPAPPPAQDAQPPMMDLAEQMNLEERRKYVKGTYLPSFSL